MKELFGKINGKEVYRYTLTDGKITVKILNLGGIVNSVTVPNKDGGFTDVVLGYNTAEEYKINDGYIGALIGRVGNRIDKGKFSLNGKEYQATVNNGENSLHGGIHGFDSKFWEVENETSDSLTLTLFSPDGEEGYPANLTVKVIYTVIGGALKIEYFANADSDTIVNLTNHTYFNLNGEGDGDILGNILWINSDEITPVDGGLIPHGEFMSVAGTPFDFNTPKAIGKDIDADDGQIKICKGYDINYCLSGKGYRNAITAYGEKSGIKMRVFTDNYGVQFYSGNFITERQGKSGKYFKRYGFCLETQNYPNAINCKNFPSPILKKGETYHTTTEYRFSVE